VHHGPPPRWAAPAFGDSSPGFRLPYALASGDAAAAFLWVKLRAGHPDNPSNKVLWVMRFPRRRQPLNVTASQPGSGQPAVHAQWPPDSFPGEIYPSGLDLPRPGCWRLQLAWAGHRAWLDVEIAPAVRHVRHGSTVPAALHGAPLRGRTGLRLLVAADPPFVIDVDSGRVTPIRGIPMRGQPVLSVQAVGGNAIAWVDLRSDLSRPRVYAIRHGSLRARLIGLATGVGPAADGRAVWLLGRSGRRGCALREVALSGAALRAPRAVRCLTQLMATGPRGTVLVNGDVFSDPASGRTLLRAAGLWTIAGDQVLRSHNSMAPLRLSRLGSGHVRRLPRPSPIKMTDDVALPATGPTIAVDFGNPAFHLSATQVMDAWLLDTRTGRFRHLPDMPAAVALKLTSMDWAPRHRLVILAAPMGRGVPNTVVAVWRPGERRLHVRALRIPLRGSGSDSFVVW
jgi:hypothetical protein